MANGLGEYFGQLDAAAPAPPLPPASPQAQFAPPPATRASVQETPPGMPHLRGTGEYFAQNGMGEYFGQNGMGAVNLGPAAPLRRPGGFRRAASRVSPLAGALGDASDVVSDAKAGAITGVAAATTVTVILLGMGLRFGSGWIVGKALAPSDGEEKAYAWGGALASTFLGAVGLGATALIAANARK